MLIKECHLEKSCYFKDRANQGRVNQGLTVGILLCSALGCIVHTYELSIVLLYIEVDVKMGEKEVNQNNHKMN